MQKKLDTPVLFLIFDRPDSTQKVFERIRRVSPAELFIAADGPRPQDARMQKRCREARGVVRNVDWDCRVHRLYRDNNLGCRKAVSSAIGWFFDNVEEGIILEDDILPADSFFWFCRELLGYYQNDTRVMHITGHNHLSRTNRYDRASYHFSKYTSIWGWATWRRAWQFYDVDIGSYPELKKNNQIKNLYTLAAEQRQMLGILDDVYTGKADIWSYQWNYAVRINNGVGVRPNRNLITNIGFTSQGRHTPGFVDKSFINNRARDIEVPLRHPKVMIIDEDTDKSIFKRFRKKSTLLAKFKKLIFGRVERVR